MAPEKNVYRIALSDNQYNRCDEAYLCIYQEIISLSDWRLPPIDCRSFVTRNLAAFAQSFKLGQHRFRVQQYPGVSEFQGSTLGQPIQQCESNVIARVFLPRASATLISSQRPLFQIPHAETRTIVVGSAIKQLKSVAV